jgi:hypothetical protein
MRTLIRLLSFEIRLHGKKRVICEKSALQVLSRLDIVSRFVELPIVIRRYTYTTIPARFMIGSQHTDIKSTAFKKVNPCNLLKSYQRLDEIAAAIYRITWKC